jgi:hypothetical protein
MLPAAVSMIATIFAVGPLAVIVFLRCAYAGMTVG